ncbi:neuraminidase-like domain-containing protein [Bordetella sp. LUAb4]|uniref:Tc toxin subunit A-related protein n=1 Tax=Bordetella sp. LUAb4 TaxID=2843195 RepID=UPI001E4D84B8|nr:neuraminidase-like domain-containing protein [Bordetella sp. LUAb4]
MSVNIDQIIGELAEREKDALAAVFRGRAIDLMPPDISDGATNKLTPELANQVLLMDLDVSWQPTTTRVAQAIASLQQYISGILAGVEPGYVGVAWKGKLLPEVTYWQDYMGQYDTWAAQVMLQTYPENYLVPSLRDDRTEQFDGLVTNINQGQINDVNTLNAIQQYLNGFEEVANLSVISGYLDGDLVELGKMLFLGRDDRDPQSYYWRQCDYFFCDDHGYPAPNAWTPWRKIDVPVDGGALMGRPRIARFNQRMFLTWFERTVTWGQTDVAGEKSGTPTITIKALCAYEKFDGTWSSPQTLTVCSHEGVDMTKNTTLFAYDTSNPDNFLPCSTMAFQYFENGGGQCLYVVLFLDGVAAAVRAGGVPFSERLICRIDPWMKDILASAPQLGSEAATVTANLFTPILPAFGKYNGGDTAPNAVEQDSTYANVGTLLATDLTCQDRVQVAMTVDITPEMSRAVMFNRTEVTVSDAETLRLNKPLPLMDAATVGVDHVKAGYRPNTVVLDASNKQAYIEFSPGVRAVASSDNVVAYYFSDDSVEGHYFLNLDSWDGEVYIRCKSDEAADQFMPLPNQTNTYDATRFPAFFCNGGVWTDLKYYGPRFNYRSALPVDSDKEIHFKFGVFLNSDGHVANTPSRELRYDGTTFDYSQFCIWLRVADGTIKSFATSKYDNNNNPIGNTQKLGPYDLTREMAESGAYVVSIYLAPDDQPVDLTSVTPTKQSAPYTALGSYSSVQYQLESIDLDKRLDPQYLYTYITFRSFDSASTATTRVSARRAFWTAYHAWPLTEMVTPVIDHTTVTDGDPAEGEAQLLNLLGIKRLVKKDGVSAAAETGDVPVAGIDADTTIPYPNVRLNTLFTSTLIHDANLGLAELYDWKTQHTPEPSVDKTDGEAQPMDFHGSNSLYFWELFYHAPAMTAYTLRSQSQFREALRWQSRIFDPRAQALTVEDEENGTPEPNYWKVVPIAPGSASSAKPFHKTLAMFTDPYAVSYIDPVHFRAGAYMDYISLLLDIGDQYYRMLTPDSLNQAMQYYTYAHAVLGVRPYLRESLRWTGSQRLSVFDAGANPVSSAYAEPLEDFEAKVTSAAGWSLSPHVGGLVQLGHNFATYFHPPINRKLYGFWDTIDARRYNLRHNLDINGNPIDIGPYATPLDPEMLLRRDARNGTLGGSVAGVTRIYPPYRYNVLSGLAQKAIGTLCGFGQQLLGYRGSIDGRQQEMLQQTQLLDLWSFTKTANQQAIDIAQGSLDSMKLSLAAAIERQDYYQELVNVGLSDGEQSAMAQAQKAQAQSLTATAMNITAGAMDSLPNVFGLANGGMHYGAPLRGIATAASIESQVVSFRGSQTGIMASYARRQQEWEQTLDQSKREVENLRQQIKTQSIQIAAARNAKAQSEAQHVQMLEMLAFLNRRYTNEALYQWLAGQMAALYHQAYDATMGLCLLAQKCWQYELGDFTTQFIGGSAWNSQHQGMLAGETLQLAMMQMEAAWYSSRNTRNLEITRTFSVKGLLGLSEADWAAKAKGGVFTFGFTEKDFYDDYPSHYMRRIASVTITLPAAVGPMQNVRAMLLQTGSTFVCAADATDMAGIVKDSTHNGGNVIRNLNANQQVALSSGIDDGGLFTLSFGDERYLPFEGSGAASNWTLTFPNPTAADQAVVLGSLDDVIVTVRYTARDGGAGFAAAVKTGVGS